MSDGFDFLGFRIRWKRKRGTNKWYVYTFIADRPVRSVKAKIRALTHKTSQWDLASVLTRLGQIMRGWANYFKHAVAKSTFSKLDTFTWWRLVHMLRARHGWNWGQLRRHLTTATGRWLIAADGVEFFRIERRDGLPLRLPGQQDPHPLATHEPRLTADTVESPLPRNRHGGFGERPGETDRWQHRHRAPGRLNMRRPSATVAQRSVRLNADAYNWWPELVTHSRSSGFRPAVSDRTSGSTRSATDTRRDLPDFVPLVLTPSGSARWTTKIGIGTSMKSRTRMALSSDHRRPVQPSMSRMSANC